MQQVYMLLRHNEQTGPYTIDELLQQQLNSRDLVWVEGKSLAWRYPEEIKELKGIFTHPKTISTRNLSNPSEETSIASERSKNPSPSKAKDEIELRAEELRQRAINYIPNYYYKNPSSPTPEYNSMGYNAERNIDFVYHSRKKWFNLSELVATAFISILLISGWYMRGSLFANKKMNIETVAIPFKPETQLPKPVSVPVQSTIVETISVAQGGIKPDSIQKAFVSKPRKNYTAVKKKDTALVANIEPVSGAQIQIQKTKKEEVIPQTSIEQPKEERVKKEQIANPKETTAVTEQTEKKKTLGQAIKGLFKKKKKEAAVVDDQNQ